MIFLQPYKKYAVFSGRAGRLEFWSFYILFCIAVPLILAFVDTLLGFDETFGGIDETADKPGFLTSLFCVIVPCFSSFSLSALFAIVLIIPLIAVFMRRLHDINMSGWWYWLPYLFAVASVVVNAIAPDFSGNFGVSILDDKIFLDWFWVVSKILNLLLLVIMLKNGDAGENRFGPDPKEEAKKYEKEYSNEEGATS